LLLQQNLEHSMSRRNDTRQDVFDHIEMFYSPQRKHPKNGMLSSVEFDKLQKLIQQGG